MKNKKTIKKKSFYFPDYSETEVFDNSKNFNIKRISLNRITFLSIIFFSLLLICSAKIIYLSLSSEKSFYSDNLKKNLLKKRRNIVDRNGSVIATNVNLYDIGVKNQNS